MTVCLHRLPILLWLVVLLPHPLPAADFTGKVVGITDGDTITVLHNGRGEKIRLNGIDCQNAASRLAGARSSSRPN